MSQQSDIDAATQAILGLVANIQAEDATLASAVTAIQAFIAAQPMPLSTDGMSGSPPYSAWQASSGSPPSQVRMRITRPVMALSPIRRW